MNAEHPSPKISPSDLYWKAYLWAWSNIREPKFTPADVAVFNLKTVWAWIAFFAGLGVGLAVAYLVLVPHQFRFPRFVLFLLTLGIFLMVGPAIEAGVIWSAWMVKSSDNRKQDST
jgi:hypothetical protein